MRLPALPKILKIRDCIFKRQRRYDNTQLFVEYRVITYNIFAGVIYYTFNNGVIEFSDFGSPKSANLIKKAFSRAFENWKKEEFFKKEMRKIANG